MAAIILIVDDDPVQRRLLENAVSRLGYRCLLAEDGEAALDILSGPDGKDVKALVLDLVMPNLDGMGTLGAMKERGLARPTIVQTSMAGIDTVVSAMRAGATDFCVKPVSFERLKVSLANALKLDAMEDAVRTLRKSSTGTFTFDDMVAGEEMEKVMRLGRRAAGSDIPVLIEGESGVGKEVIAKAIQGESARSGKPFVTVNCGALPEALAESILFGHEKGAFTGADRAHTGKFKDADGGTLFLDEVGELTPELQVKLLRAIQEGEIDPVGAKRPVKTNFRLISATNRTMMDMVTEGRFREDLYYRLNVFPVTVPPLRARRGDIAALVRHFTARICLEEGRRQIGGIRSDALDLLVAHDWPGNIRQLENTLFRAIVLCDGDELTLEEFPQIAAGVDAMGGAGATVVPLGNDAKKPVSSAVASAAVTENGNGRSAYGMIPMVTDKGDVVRMDRVEETMIRFAIDHHDGRMTAVARSLGIGRSTLYRKLKELSIDPDDPQPVSTAG